MNIFLETSRLTIKAPSSSDFDNWFQLLSDAEVMRFIGQGVLNQSEVEVQLTKAIQHYQEYGFTLGSVYEKENNTFIGRAGLRYLYFDKASAEIELGCALHKAYWGKNYASELMQALFDWAFNTLSLPRLIAQVDPVNLRSKNLIEKFKMRFVKYYLYEGKYNVMRYEMFKNDF